jgi:hypothetical protein
VSEPQRLYRAELGSRVDAKTGHSTLSWYGTVTECGEWVEQDYRNGKPTEMSDG